jgi:hypothetical protein
MRAWETRGYYGRVSTATRLSRRGCVVSLICPKHRCRGVDWWGSSHYVCAATPVNGALGEEQERRCGGSSKGLVEEWVRVLVHADWWRRYTARAHLATLSDHHHHDLQDQHSAGPVGQSACRFAGPQQRGHASRCSVPKCLTSAGHRIHLSRAEATTNRPQAEQMCVLSTSHRGSLCFGRSLGAAAASRFDVLRRPPVALPPAVFATTFLASI